LLSRLEDSTKALVLSSAIGGGMLGCIADNTSTIELQRLKLQECSAKTRQDISSAIQGIIDNLDEINWTEVYEDCVKDGKYAIKYDCTGKNRKTLESNYMNILAKLLQIQINSAIYCPYYEKRGTTTAYVRKGDSGIFLNKPIKDNCDLQGVLMHEAHHLEAEDDKNMEKFDKEAHDMGTDYGYTIGIVAQRACERNKNSKKISTVLNEIDQFLNKHEEQEK